MCQVAQLPRSFLQYLVVVLVESNVKIQHKPEHIFFCVWQRCNHVKALWTETPFWGSHIFRKWERKAFLTLDYVFEAVYSWLIEKASHIFTTAAPNQKDQASQLVFIYCRHSALSGVHHHCIHPYRSGRAICRNCRQHADFILRDCFRLVALGSVRCRPALLRPRSH